MKYVEYKLTYKNGIIENHILEIEPDELDETVKALFEVQEVINESFKSGVNAVIRLRTTEGFLMVSVVELQSVLIKGLNFVSKDGVVLYEE